MDLGLRDKVAIVTGGSAGIGLETARLLLNEGAKVAICGRDEVRLALAVQELMAGKTEMQLLAQTCNVLDETQVKAFVGAVVSQWGSIDILINNAGRGRTTTFQETDDAAWREEFEIKFFSIVYPVRAVYPYMKAQGGGRIININAVLSRQPEPHMVATSAMRSGVLNLTKSLATEFALDNITVNSINLGTIMSGQWQRRYQTFLQQGGTLGEEEWVRQEAAKRQVPLGRLGRPEEVAYAIVMLTAAQASYITGTSLDVAGGTNRYV